MIVQSIVALWHIQHGHSSEVAADCRAQSPKYWVNGRVVLDSPGKNRETRSTGEGARGQGSGDMVRNPPTPGTSRWEKLGSRRAYSSPWLDVWLDDVRTSSGKRIEHHVVKFPKASVGAVVAEEDRVLLIWRHRYITDRWGWEIPAGWGLPGERPEESVVREIEEETGWRPRRVERMFGYRPLAGISSLDYQAFIATHAVRIGKPVDGDETAHVEWIRLSDIPSLAGTGLITDGPSLTVLLYYMAVYGSLRGSNAEPAN
jgi:8-oxo-dGTP pyrophosphatase MutT (NUDIX family)